MIPDPAKLTTNTYYYTFKDLVGPYLVFQGPGFNLQKQRNEMYQGYQQPQRRQGSRVGCRMACFLHGEECMGKQCSCLWYRVFLRAMSKRNNQEMIRMGIGNSILRCQLRKKHGSGNNALMKAETPPCSLLSVTLKKQGTETQNAESDPESAGHTFYCSVYSESTQKKLLFFFPLPVFLSCY